MSDTFLLDMGRKEEVYWLPDEGREKSDTGMN